MNTFDPQAMAHFLEMAFRGDHPAASSAEQQAARLARAIADESPGLDQKARDGAGNFLNYAAIRPEYAQEMLATKKF